MSQTRAVPAALLEAANRTQTGGMPLCPRCRVGYLQPFYVTVSTRDPGSGWGFEGADYLEGWVAVCHGNAVYREQLRAQIAALDTAAGQGGQEWEPELELAPACGFWMQMTAGRLTPGH